MNYLAHLLLAGENPQAQLGSLLGDFTRGRLQTLAHHYPYSVMFGIEVHRKIDRFTDDHPCITRSKQRFSANQSRFAGIIVDVLHDHFLSRHWGRFSDHDRETFISHCYSLLREHHDILPPRLQHVGGLMIEQDWLGSYLEIEAIDLVYQRLSKRFSRKNPMGRAIGEVMLHYQSLQRDFLDFFPEVQAYAQELNQSLRITVSD